MRDKVVSENDIVEKEIYIEAIGAQEHRQGLGLITYKASSNKRFCSFG